MTLWNLSESPVDQKMKVKEDVFDKEYGAGEKHSLLKIQIERDANIKNAYSQLCADDIIDDICNLHLGIRNEKIKLTKRKLI